MKGRKTDLEVIKQLFANKVDLSSRDAFYENLKRSYFGPLNQRIPVSPTPYLIDAKRYYELKWLCEKVLESIEIILREYIHNKKLQDRFPELQDTRILSLHSPSYSHWIHLARFDIAVTSNGEFKLLETNCDCPGGIFLMPLIKECYEAVPKG